MRRLVVAGVASGVGKTTAACALMAAFRRRGQEVQPFKVGPDYIDPSYHSQAAGRASRNLDSYLLPHDALRALFARAAAHADLSMIEGVMGLFDGRLGTSEEGSTAEVAKLLDAPVLVVIDVAAMVRTAAALALGCLRFDPALRIVGFVLNRVGGEAHARWVAEAIEQATGLPVLGTVPREEALALPERHLGLVPTAEQAPSEAFFERLADLAERHFALERIWELAYAPEPRVGQAALFPSEPQPRRARIAVARDEAFNFYYEDALDLLEAWGAELVPFSPLRDTRLPSGAQGVYVGGGFPELHARALGENAGMRDALRRSAACGVVIYAECGGLMYLGRTLADFEGRRHPMVGLLPLDSVMQRRRLTLGYRTVTALRASPLLAAGETARGHEFHWSELATAVPLETAAYRIAERDGQPEGFVGESLLASYVHLHFGASVAMARRLIAACAGAAGVVG